MKQRWKVFAVLALLFIVGFLYRVSMAVVSRDLTADLGLTAAQLGMLSGIFFYFFACAQIPLGPMIDRFGGRRIMSILGIVTTCGSLIFAFAPNYAAALTGRALLGLGTAGILMGALKIFTNWFTNQEFPKVSGFMIAAGNLGSVFATAPLAFMITKLTWRHTFLGITIAQALATIAVFRYTQDAPYAKERDLQVSAEGVRSTLGMLNTWKFLLRSKDFWLVGLIAFFWYANYMVLLALWGGPYLMEAAGLDRSSAGFVLMCISIGYITGSILLGKAIDFFGGSLEKTILCGQALLLVMMTAMLGPGDHLDIGILIFIFLAIGFFSASGVIIYPLARNLVPHNSAATAMTAVNFFLLMGAATIQHIMGHIISSFPRTSAEYPPSAYHYAFLLPICGLGCTLILFTLRKVMSGFDACQSD
jgi:sugar phosphate permease